jgi:hypothetical protein
MPGKKLTVLMAASAVVALVGALPAAHAQMMGSMPPPMMAPPMQSQTAPPPMQRIPDEVDFYSNAPKVEPGDNPANWSARENVVESRRYEQLIHTSRAFRQARIQKECGGFNESEAYQQCAASFDE